MVLGLASFLLGDEEHIYSEIRLGPHLSGDSFFCFFPHCEQYYIYILPSCTITGMIYSMFVHASVDMLYWLGLYFLLKGTLPRDFRFRFFFTNQFPPSPWVSLGAFQICSKILGDFLQLKVHHQCRWHRWQILSVCHLPKRNYLPPASLTRW